MENDNQARRRLIELGNRINERGILFWQSLFTELGIESRIAQGNIYLPCFNCDTGARRFKVRLYTEGSKAGYPCWHCYNCGINKLTDKEHPLYLQIHPSFTGYIRLKLGPDEKDPKKRHYSPEQIMKMCEEMLNDVPF